MASVLESPAGCYILILLDICWLISSPGINISLYETAMVQLPHGRQSVAVVALWKPYLETNALSSATWTS